MDKPTMIHNGNSCQSQTGDTSETQKNEYRIYQYLKKNPGLLTGLGAIAIAILTALISFCSFLYESAMLGFRNIDLAYLNLETANVLYRTVASFVLVCVLFFMFPVYDIISEKKKQLDPNIVYLKKIKKEYRKELLREKINEIRFRLLQNNTSPEMHANKIKPAIDELSRKIHNAHKETRRELLGDSLIMGFILMPSMFIWIYSGISDPPKSIIEAFIVAAVITILVELMFWFIFRYPLNKKAIKNNAVQDYKASNIQKDVPIISFPFKNIFKGKYNLKVSDQKIKQGIAGLLLFAVLIVFALAFIFPYLGYDRAIHQTQFMITVIDKVEYAVLYNNGENAISAICERSGDDLTINLSCQKVISVENLEYTVRIFKSVIWNNDPDYKQD